MARNMPQAGRRYPVRLGRSMLQPQGSGGREHFALRFQHLPDNIAVARPGMIRRVGDKLFMHLPAGDGKGMKFTGTRMSPPSPNVSEYLLIFHDDVLYLERLSAIFYNVRPVDGRTTDAPNVPPTPEMEVDSDPWVAPPASVSPVTQEEDGASEDRHSPTHAPAAHKALKGTPGTPRKTTPSVIGRRNLGPKKTIKKATGGKSVATKSVPPPRSPRDGSDGESSDCSSSSSSNGSSSSGSDNSNDSDDFTDSSSDEE